MNRITVNVHSNGDYWQAQWVDDLCVKRKRGLGSKSKFTKRQAEVLAREIEADINANLRKARGEVAPTLVEFLARYLAHRSDLGEATRKLHDQACCMLRQYFGDDRRIDQISKVALDHV